MQMQWNFDTGRSGFRYADDLFGDAGSGRYAQGWYSSRAGDGNDGALLVGLGGQDGRRIADISGGWTKGFATDTPGVAELTFRYKLTASAHFESDEYGEVRVALDGETFGRDGSGSVARLRGDGEGGRQQSTGWQEVTISLGTLDAGHHDLDLGGYLNRKTAWNETVNIIFDDIRLDLEPTGAADDDSVAGGDTDTDTGTGTGLDAFEAEVLRLTNAFRAENGRDPLQADARLTAAAEDWSREMAEGDFFRHSDTSAQVEAEGYDWRALGENIAAGYATPEDVVAGWIGSAGHRRNMLSANFEEIGIGYVHQENDGGNVRYGHYWTQIFGTEADSLI